MLISAAYWVHLQCHTQVLFVRKPTLILNLTSVEEGLIRAFFQQEVTFDYLSSPTRSHSSLLDMNSV